jgi:hypothetical protein
MAPADSPPITPPRSSTAGVVRRNAADGWNARVRDGKVEAVRLTEFLEGRAK